MPVSELIGIAFDENSTWGQCTLGELKGLIHLALKNYDEAKEWVEMFLTFNDNLATRKKFFQALNVVLDITLEDLELQDYIPNLTRMYGEEVLDNAIKSVSGEIRFFGLFKTNMQLEGIDKHLKLIESYNKLQLAKQPNQ